MAKQQGTEAESLTVRATFQPNRFAERSLAEAYDWLLPIRHGYRKSNRQMESGKEGNDETKASSDLRTGEFRKAG